MLIKMYVNKENIRIDIKTHGAFVDTPPPAFLTPSIENASTTTVMVDVVSEATTATMAVRV